MARRKIWMFLLVVGPILCLLQVWVPQYYLTGDGPCHLYNASVLHHLWTGRNVAFYREFFQIIYQPNPNWLSHILLSIPLYITNGVVAEKLFLSVYMGLLLSGFWFLIRKISGKESAWPLAIFLLVFNHALAKGFYNFSLATAFYLWVVFAWLLFLEKRSNRNAILFFVFSGFTFFTQLLPFVFGMITCFALSCSYAFSGKITEHRPVNYLVKNLLALAIFSAPFLFLMLWFIMKEHGLGVEMGFHPYRISELVQLKYLVTVTKHEFYITPIAGITVTSLFAVALWSRFKDGFAIRKYDGFLFAFVLVFLVYLCFPESFLSRVILMTLRAQLFVYILMVLVAAYCLSEKIKEAGGIILFVCFIGLTIVRFPVMLSASEACADHNSALPYIKPNSVVLPLDFSPVGKMPDGKVVADANWLFVHCSGYLGTEKPMILLDNYEANTGYFPLMWQHSKNPYAHLSKWDGIEAQPPGGDIVAYENASNRKVDYVLMWCYDNSFTHATHFAELKRQIDSLYHPVYTSPTKRTMLFERNGI